MASIFVEDLFAGEVALVTGGGTGIGLAVATELGSLGAKVAICGRREEPIATALKHFEEQGINGWGSTCDIRQAESVEALIDSVLERFGQIDVLINNAGGQFPSPAQMISPKGFEAVVRNNLVGTWNMTHAVANKAMIPQQRGKIINIIANVARGFPGMAHTGAARAGVDNLTKTLAVEWSTFGIRVNAVAPGVIRTTGTKKYPPELLETAERSVPLRRLGTAQECSHLITYLASKYADYITGETVYIDGGQRLFGDGWEIPRHVPQRPPYPVPTSEDLED